MHRQPIRQFISVLTFSLLLAAGARVGAEEFDKVAEADNHTLITGPEVGERIPDFAGRDQHGKVRTFDDIKGPNGAMILFHRSADW